MDRLRERLTPLVVLLLVVCLGLAGYWLAAGPPDVIMRVVQPGKDDAEQACFYYRQASLEQPLVRLSTDQMLALAQEEANQAADASGKYRPLLRAMVQFNKSRQDPDELETAAFLVSAACREL